MHHTSKASRTLVFTLAAMFLGCNAAQAAAPNQPMIRAITTAGSAQLTPAAAPASRPLEQVDPNIRAWLAQQEAVDAKIFAPDPSPLDNIGTAPVRPRRTSTPIASARQYQQPVIRAFLADGGRIETAPQTTAAPPTQASRFCAWPMTCPKPTARRAAPGRAYGRKTASLRALTYAQNAPLNFSAYQREVDYAATVHGVDPLFVRAIMHAESSFNARARSPVGAAGLMQLMPATARRFGVSNSYSPLDNIKGGTQYLAWLLRRFKGNWQLAAAAYNAGEGAVDRHGGIPPYRETIDYVSKVSTLLSRYHAASR